MGKRSRQESFGERSDTSARKRPRLHDVDRLSLLSDELLLRTLFYLGPSDLVRCQRLSRRLKILAGDSQLWKALFYDRFVRPRAARIPGIRRQGISEKSLHYSSRISRWLEDDHLVKRGTATNWKRQYKLRHNWSRGRASVSETEVADRPSTPPILLRLHEDIVLTAEVGAGLKAWSLKGKDRLLAEVALFPTVPTALAIDEQDTSAHWVNISIGFDNGSFAIYTLCKEKRSFTRSYAHPPSRNGTVHAIAYSSPYLLTMTGAPLLSLYRFDPKPNASSLYEITAPKLLSSLRSHTVYLPISLVIRSSLNHIVASIAYAMPTWTSGWSVGLQEIRLTEDGAVLESRMASASDRYLIKEYTEPFSTHLKPVVIGEKNVLQRRSSISKPTSLSYNHPYLLCGHPDNTLTLYMITSNTQELKIGVGHRLFGHNSSISGAYVGDRGKAVSVGTFGDELRVWELEGGISPTAKKSVATGGISVQVRPDRSNLLPDAQTRNILDPKSYEFNRQELRTEHGLEESQISKGWVAFDEEKVVLLREKMQGAQALVTYDFS